MADLRVGPGRTRDGIARRHLLACAAAPALVSAAGATLAAPRMDDAAPDGAVQFVHDGLGLAPAAYARLLARLAASSGEEADEYSRGGVVARLEAAIAAALGKETAVYLPTGTLANHLAVRVLARAAGGSRVLVQAASHLYNDTGDGAQRLSGLVLVPLAPDRACFDADDVEAELRRAESGRVASAIGAISVESPVRRRAGEVVSMGQMKRVSRIARDRGIGLHLDGARLFIASAYTGIAPADYAALFDTVYVSLYKCFSSAGGAVLAGPRRLLGDLYHERRMFGGGVFQSWPDAAVALHHLDGFAERQRRAVAAADVLFAALDAHGRCRVERVATGTNVARLVVRGADAASLPARLRTSGITIGAAVETTSAGATFFLVTNETLLRRAPHEIAAAFTAALG